MNDYEDESSPIPRGMRLPPGTQNENFVGGIQPMDPFRDDLGKYAPNNMLPPEQNQEVFPMNQPQNSQVSGEVQKMAEEMVAMKFTNSEVNTLDKLSNDERFKPVVEAFSEFASSAKVSSSVANGDLRKKFEHFIENDIDKRLKNDPENQNLKDLKSSASVVVSMLNPKKDSENKQAEEVQPGVASGFAPAAKNGVQVQPTTGFAIAQGLGAICSAPFKAVSVASEKFHDFKAKGAIRKFGEESVEINDALNSFANDVRQFKQMDPSTTTDVQKSEKAEWLLERAQKFSEVANENFRKNIGRVSRGEIDGDEVSESMLKKNQAFEGLMKEALDSNMGKSLNQEDRNKLENGGKSIAESLKSLMESIKEIMNALFRRGNDASPASPRP